jgi:hypothetical protein
MRVDRSTSSKAARVGRPRLALSSLSLSLSLVLGASACRALQTAPLAASRAASHSHVEPATAAACRACAGDWAPHGLATAPSCLCPTGDGDKRCRDGAECEGQCLADAGEREITAAGPPARGYFVGKCSRYRTSFGCHRYIAAGAVGAGPVLLDEAPSEICAD